MPPKQTVHPSNSPISRRALAQPLCEVIKQPGLVIDPNKRTVIAHGRVVELTKTEFDLLRHLAAAGTACSRRDLLAAVWGNDTHVTQRSVDTIVNRLRSKLGDAHQGKQFIVSVRGVGYKAAHSDITS